MLAHGLLADPGAVPLVIGIVGHRDPVTEVEPILQSNLKRQLQQLISQLPHTPLIMLNGLAEGIDIITANVFLEVVGADQENRGSKATNHQLVAVLPKSPEKYREDFQDAKALAAHDQILSRCNEVLTPINCNELSLPKVANAHPRADDDPTCYEQQGFFLTQHSHLLIAFSDGIDTHLKGGTSQTIAMHKGEFHRRFTVDGVLASKETGVLIEHKTPRRRENSPTADAGKIKYWPVVEGDSVEIPTRLLAFPHRLDEINRKISAQNFQPTCYNTAEGSFTRLWSLADNLAKNSKKNYELLCKALVISGTILILLSESLEEIVKSGRGLWFLLVVITLALIPKLQHRPKRDFISYRCLAECLTVQHLWRAIDIKNDAADLFHTRYNDDLSWIRSTLRAVRVQLLCSYATEARLVPQSIEKAMIWMQGQIAFLDNKIKVFEHLSRRLMLFAIIFFIAAVLMAILAISQNFSMSDQSQSYRIFFSLIICSFSALAYSRLMGYRDTKERYKRSLEQFKRAQIALKEASELPSNVIEYQRIVIEAVGLEKLDELNDWVADQLQRVYAPGT